ncbi:Ig-like domain-containing protein [Mucilaginibacter sp.]|uniref:Ig-like domain-containing protein n=1 Tax=Mucilaginibacter sp. TaxID=1882438 RepID=UPI0032670009
MKKILLIAITIAFCASACVKELVVNPDQSVELTLDTVFATVGQSQQIVPLNYSPEQLNWQSADTAIVSVSANGLAKAKKVGQSVITVSTKNNKSKATCLVIVKAAVVLPPVTPIDTPATPGNIRQIPGLASDVGIGADSSIYVIGTDDVSPTGGFGIYKVVGGVMVKLPDCAGVRIAVAPNGTPWVVNKSHLIYRKTATDLWELMPGTANDIGIGADGSVFIIGTNDVSPTGGYNIMKWNGTNWDNLPNCAGTRITVAPDGTPWVVNKSHLVYRKTATELWEVVGGVEANDIAWCAFTNIVNVTGKDTGTAASSPIYQYAHDTTWYIHPDGAYGESIAMTPHGLPVWVDKQHRLFMMTL